MQVEMRLFEDSTIALFEQETWKECPGFVRYEVSTMGRFRNKATGKFQSGTVAHNGYQHIGLIRNGKQVWKLAHRLIAEAWIEAESTEHCVVNHKNKVRTDNRVSNLEWATRSQNAKHAHRK